MSRHSVTLAFSFVVLLATCSTCQAALISANDATFGPNSITQDTGTGLDWLDINFSDGMSFQAVASQMGAGGTFAGFRHATAAELNQFMINAGIDPTAAVAVFNFTPAQNFETLVGGPTAVQSFSGGGVSVGSFIVTFGMTSDAPTATTRNYGGTSWTTSTLLGGPAGFGIAMRGTEVVTTANPDYGHWLVRVVPEPGTFALLVTGAAVLMTRRRRA